MDKNLYQIIKTAQLGNKKDMLLLIDKFKPLINKHSYYLKYDDAEGDITLAFIETIHKINLNGFEDDNDYAILYYIKKSVQNSFYHLAQKNHIINNTNLPFDDKIEVIQNNSNELLSIELIDILSKLTPLQKNVILYKYYYGYSDVEIAKSFSISRQSVNKIKNRAFITLRKELDKQ